MSAFEASVAFDRWSRETDPPPYVVGAAVPSFKAFSESQTGWDALRALFQWSEQLVEALPNIAARSQGTVFLDLRTLDDVRRAADVVSSINREARFDLFTLGIGSIELASQLWTGCTGSASLRYAAYLAAQHSRAIARGIAVKSDSELIALMQDGRIDDSLLVQILYSIPVSPRSDDDCHDGLEAWSTDRAAPTGFAVLTDLHSTKTLLQPDIRRCVAQHRAGEISVGKLEVDCFAIRESHNRLFDLYFNTLLSAKSPRLFRAAGDGAAGFVDDLVGLRSREQLASSKTRGLLRSGIAAVRVVDSSFDAKYLDLGLFVSKLMKEDASFERLVRCDQQLDHRRESLVLRRLENDVGALAQATRFTSLWETLAPRVSRLVSRITEA